MNYYKLMQDSATGKLIHAFWHACTKVEEAAENYAKVMGATSYYFDPKYFAGGVACVAFDKKPNMKMWREAGSVNGEMQYVPNVDRRSEWVEVPTKDYQPRNTFDHLYSPMPAQERKGKWYKQCMVFEYKEEPGVSGNGTRTASRDVRKAIKAEVLRMRLPVVKTDRLLTLLQASWTPAEEGQKVKKLQQTPTFFAYEQYYIIGCELECKAPGLTKITPQQHRTYHDLAKRLANRKEN